MTASRYFLDANVLYPFHTRDVLLRFGEAGLFRPRWSEEVLDEWRRNLLKKRPDREQSIASQIDAMGRAFPEALIENYNVLTPALELPDENDCHVLAAAIKADAQHIITNNLKDFPDDALADWDITAVPPDVFLESTFELYPEAAASALAEMRRGYEKPPYDPAEFLLMLTRVGLPRLSATLRPYIDIL